jgi:hypothetical protein
MIIEGPNEPSVMDAFLEPLVEDLVRLAPPKPADQQACGQPQAQATTSQGERLLALHHLRPFRAAFAPEVTVLNVGMMWLCGALIPHLNPLMIGETHR